MINKKIKAFTLVELIITITILAILAAIGFSSYTGYISGVRDTNRVTQLESIGNGLKIYKIKYSLPIPDDYIGVTANSETIAYQGYAGETVLEKIGYDKKGKDPKTDKYFTYYISSDKKHYQLMTFLEDGNELETSFIYKNLELNAFDYSGYFPFVSGEKLGILTDEFNTPIHEIQEIINLGEIDLGGTNSGTLYNSYIDNTKKYSLSGSILEYKLFSLSKPALYKAPDNCPEGFIGVPGNKQFNQAGFCVAKYEMSFDGLTDTDNSGDWNTYSYLDNGDQGTVVSKKGNSPIAEITQSEAISECNAMGKGYHLITNNEWMTISRNIELEKVNWSNSIVGDGFIYNGISNELTMGCSGTGTTYLPSTTSYGTVTGADICNQKNKLTLSNGEEIWDFAGNVWEHVNKSNTLDGTNNDLGQTAVSGTTNGTGWDDDGIYSIGDMDLYGSILQKGISSGMGNVFYSDGITNNIFVRGGSASDGSNGGLYLLILGSDNSTQNYSTGFRCTRKK